MNFFSNILYFCSIVYFVSGVVMLHKNRKAALNRAFFALNLSLFIWSFFLALSTASPDKASCMLWSTITAFGYCSFPSTSIHFFLIYTKKEKLLKKWWIYLILYLPVAIFFFQALKHDLFVSDFIQNQFGWISITNVRSVWFLLFISSIASSGMINISLCYCMQKKVTSVTERKQIKTILISAVVSFLYSMGIVLLTKIIINVDIPDITVTGLMIWQLGILYAIKKYRLMTLSPAIAAESILQTIIDSVILVNPQGLITYVNAETLFLLGYEKADLLEKPIEMLFPTDIKSSMIHVIKTLEYGPIRNKDISFISRNNTRIPILFSAAVCKNNDGDYLGFVALSRDITKYKHAEDEIKYLATHDSLTGLPNRLMLLQILGHTIEVAKRYNRKFAIFFIDLDRFKMINDTKGHDAGDQLLQEIAKRYTQTLRAADVVSRQGGDEFIVLIDDVHKASDLRLIARNLLANTYKPVILQGDECRVTASIGISVYPKDGEDAQVLMKHADMAMYYAKEEGKNNFQFYSKNILLELTGRMDIEQNLRYALERNELSLHYQAKVNLKTSAITGVEALLRWQSPQLGSVTPTQFIPVAEETGMILSIGKWVLRTACIQNVAWQKQGLPAVCMAVNLSLKQLTDNELIDDIEAALKDSGMAPNLLELEITESMIMSNPKKMRDVLVRIKSMGVRLAIDDFGTGYSSLAQLKHFPIDTLKIDRSFIRNVPDNSEDKAITHAIIAMGETLGFAVVAEGVETLEQMNYLKGQACDEMQGFYFSKPVVPEEFALLLQKQAGTSAE
ncbi:EAL domain-containing protein [uncultured Sphaerochaeta sp.]|uniref:EAL domain-containing protein n=1 Tax=uncultured Sphaerochaeta sp. TaxID=886478 RepID=UPI002A0A3290|nr:EAL domain-containing protein [uncultured Sphaerochaeta sp.]